MLTSYDIDGVLTNGIKPEPPFIVVSGRLNKFAQETKEQMTSFGVDKTIPIFLRPCGEPADRVCAGYWKSFMIACYHVHRHFEDDPVQIDIIKKNCPWVEIVKV